MKRSNSKFYFVKTLLNTKASTRRHYELFEEEHNCLFLVKVKNNFQRWMNRMEKITKISTLKEHQENDAALRNREC
jgi:hypothetical protein